MEENEKLSPDSSLPPDETAPSTPPMPPLLKAAHDLFDIIELFVICAAFILCLFTFVIRPTVVEGSSMEDTLLERDLLLMSPVAYEPAQGDIVVVQNISLPHYHEPIVKRVIAVGGQTIDIDFTTWTVTVDGQVLEEPYRKITADRLLTSDWTYPMEIPEGYLFVMGDNRNKSADSRSAEIGLIDERCVAGHALLRFFPFSRFAVFN